MRMDETDRKILAMLKEDARASNVSMAKQLGLTEGAVRHRINNLVSSGVIRRFTIELAGASGTFAIVMAKSKSETKRMMAEISALGVADEAYEIAGDFDGCIIISGSSMEEIDSKIDRIRGCPSVADTKTFVSFKKY